MEIIDLTFSKDSTGMYESNIQSIPSDFGLHLEFDTAQVNDPTSMHTVCLYQRCAGDKFFLAHTFRDVLETLDVQVANMFETDINIVCWTQPSMGIIKRKRNEP